MKRSTKSLMSGLRRRSAPGKKTFARGLITDIHRNERKRLGSKLYRQNIKRISGYGRFQ